MDPDSKDMKILEALREDSRKSIKEISKTTKIRPSTVHQRIQKLIANKIIEKFTVKLDNKSVGENFIVFMLVKGNTAEYIDLKILNDRHVREIFGVTGEYDLLVKLKFRNVEEFNDFVLKFRKDKKEIQSTLTMVATANLKEEL
ncbi:Lrp/AsnC family transcriptional regulator [Candidatus Woesearchaeota archaeon]|nr:Lrp/AsnC family transcriptional regulator [Candidatus Woesearchaeota archaeon]